MGLAASQFRLIALTAAKSDLEFEGQMINQKRLELSARSGRIYQRFLAILRYNLDPQPVDGQTEEERQAKERAIAQEQQELQIQLELIQSLDKALEMQLKRVDTEHQAIQTEISAVKKVIDKNIEMSFKTFA